MNLLSMLAPEVARRLRLDTARSYDIPIEQTVTVNGGATATQASQPYTLEAGYAFIWYATSGQVYTPAAWTDANNTIVGPVGMSYPWDTTVQPAAANPEINIVTINNFAIQFRLNNEVQSPDFIPFSAFCGPSVDRARVLPVPLALIGQTPVGYTLENTAPANFIARSYVVLHTVRYNLQ